MISAPGKILWIGSYSVVFGGLGHVIAIDKRVRCEVHESNIPIYETSFGTFSQGGNELIESVITELNSAGHKVPPLRVRLMNDPEFIYHGRKTGLGSSSAATVALTAAIYEHIYKSLDLNAIYKIAQRANWRRQKGIGSGFDIAAAVYGSVVYRKFSDVDKVDSYQEPLRIGSNVSMLVGVSGRPSSTVELVRKFMEGKPRVEGILKDVMIENELGINLLRRGKVDEAAAHARLARELLAKAAKTVGVDLHGELGRVIEEAEEWGAYAAMSPGAGGGEIYFAIGDDLKKVEELWKNEG